MFNAKNKMESSEEKSPESHDFRTERTIYSSNELSNYLHLYSGSKAILDLFR